jgi:hypothetical protein
MLLLLLLLLLLLQIPISAGLNIRSDFSFHQPAAAA